MRHHGVYRLYVQGEGNGAAGVIAYPDIAGILYQYCHECKYSRLRRSDKTGADPVLRFRVKDVMSTIGPLLRGGRIPDAGSWRACRNTAWAPF